MVTVQGGQRTTLPRWRGIADDLGARITDGDYQPGQRLPGEHELAASYNTSRFTTVRVLNELAQRGLVSRRQGVGTFVADTPTPVATTLIIREHTRFMITPGRSDSDFHIRGWNESDRIVLIGEVEADPLLWHPDLEEFHLQNFFCPPARPGLLRGIAVRVAERRDGWAMSLAIAVDVVDEFTQRRCRARLYADASLVELTCVSN